MTDEKGKTINGRKYSFDEYGRMNAEWVNWEATPSTASAGSASYTTGYRYYGAVSYTHLDVYKRQNQTNPCKDNVH